MLGAILLGFVAGAIARMLMPGDVFAGMSGPSSWLASIVIGRIGAFVGWVIFTQGFGIGDDDILTSVG